jgi:predicted transcriptional regulator
VGNLTETLKLRLEPETMRELERQATAADRPASYLARAILRDGLAKRKAEKVPARRVG